MTILLLAVIYLAFISLGLPDSLLGSAWPSMYQSMGSTISGAGTLAMLISACTIISSLLADRMIHKFGTHAVTTVSVGMTATALFGFASCTSYLQLALWCIPYGLGAGAVDSALNNFVALHYSSRHMSWLHCMWGVGASLGPWIMGLCLSSGRGWPSGYRFIGILQIILTLILILSMPLWKQKMEAQETDTEHKVLSLTEAISLPKAKAIMTAFLCYCGLEMTAGLWAASWLVSEKGVSPETAASFAAFFYVGITVGRAVSGFISEHFGDQKMIRLGEGIILTGIIMLIISGNSPLSKTGLIVIGLGCAPVYPSIIHSTPARFGKEHSQSLVGIQMASAYIGSTFAPKVFAVLSDFTGMWFYPFYLCIFVVLMTLMTEHAKGEQF